jgi:hypothetical protein
MGTPTTHISQELERPSISEKIKLLEEGKGIGKRMDFFGDLSQIFENVKEILLPLVPWLDKPLSPGKVRGMIVFEGRYFNIALERSGGWMVQLPRSKEKKWLKNVAFADHLNLGGESYALLEISLRSSEGAKHLMEETPFLHSIARYNGILRILEECFERVTRLLAEREERMQVMHERLALLKDFTEALDPLRAEGTYLPLAGHSIFNHHSHGSSLFTGTYLHEGALTPFYEHLKSQGTYTGSYRAECRTFHAHSLSEFLERIRYLVGEIAVARARGEKDAAQLTGASHTGRLPFTDKEINILKGIADAITR